MLRVPFLGFGVPANLFVLIEGSLRVYRPYDSRRQIPKARSQRILFVKEFLASSFSRVLFIFTASAVLRFAKYPKRCSECVGNEGDDLGRKGSCVCRHQSEAAPECTRSPTGEVPHPPNRNDATAPPAPVWQTKPIPSRPTVNYNSTMPQRTPWDGREPITDAMVRFGVREDFQAATDRKDRAAAIGILCEVGADEETARRIVEVLVPADKSDLPGPSP